MDTSGLLLSRPSPPRLPPDCLPRDELVSRVVDDFDGRLTVILAGAGYGKSTLLAQALARQDRPSVWCSCDERLADPALLLAHLATGIRRAFPGFGASLALTGGPEAQVIACPARSSRWSPTTSSWHSTTWTCCRRGRGCRPIAAHRPGGATSTSR